MIASNIGGNLGNHMWHYAICRAVAEKLNYDWGVDKVPIKGSDYFDGMNQMYFMNVDFGKEITGIEQTYNDIKKTHTHLGQEYWFNFYDENVFNIKDNTLIQLISQSEDYFYDIRDRVLKWFEINDEYKKLYDLKISQLGFNLDENTCIINFRGGEYTRVPNLIARSEYWRDSINHMLKLNPNMNFVIITDDPHYARIYIGDYPCYHVDIGFDFYCVNQAKYVILSNSSFGWWAAWLNTNSKLTIAPKYWCVHNVSDGFWSLGDSYSRCFVYMDRDGTLSDYEKCKNDAMEFYKKNNLI
jgi:hypothetical protein